MADPTEVSVFRIQNFETSLGVSQSISDETGSGSLVFGTSPIITPAEGLVGSAASFNAGYIGLPQSSSTTGPYTVAASDAGKHIYSTANRTITIDSNSNLLLPIGTRITFIAGPSATVTIKTFDEVAPKISDTIYLAGLGYTGSRTLNPYGVATIVKVTETTWFIYGDGLI